MPRSQMRRLGDVALRCVCGPTHVMFKLEDVGFLSGGLEVFIFWFMRLSVE